MRLLAETLPEFRTWQEPLTEATGAAFDWTVAGPDGGNMVDGMASYFAPGSTRALQIVLRDGIVFNEAADGLGWHPSRTVLLNRSSTAVSGGAFAAALSALNELREQAAEQFQSDGSGPDQPSAITERRVEAAADRLTDLAELILHESGHVFGVAEFGADLGISGDWYDGPQYRDFDAITTYETPSNSAYVLATLLTGPGTIAAPWVALQGLLVTLFPLLGPFAGLGLTDLLQNPPALISNHYVLTLFSNYWECLLRQNRGPLNALQNHACGCDSEGSGTIEEVPDAPPAPGKYPIQWGWWLDWPPGERPCDQVPLPIGRIGSPDRWNCTCNPFNCRCAPPPSAVAPWPFC